MPRRSERSQTLIGLPHRSERQDTIKRLLELLDRGDIRRVTLRSYTAYRSRILSDRGSQFTVYTGDGVNTFNKGDVVVKCAKLRVGVEPLSQNDDRRERANALYREVQVLTHARLRLHPNIPALLWYDFIDLGNKMYIPALIMERATFGSLSELLRNSPSALDESGRIEVCRGIAAGLLALHKAGIVHGDVKSENILVFRSSHGENLVPKIADFGSVIMLEEGEDSTGKRTHRYFGTPSMNAPEVSQRGAELDSIELIKCDNYSLGLVIVEVVVGHLDSSLEAKTPSVVQHAYDEIRGAGLSDASLKIITYISGSLLAYDSTTRCADLSVVVDLLHPPMIEELGASSSVLPIGDFSRFRDADNVAKSLQTAFGRPDYLDITLDVELVSERDTQALLFETLLKESKASDDNVAGKALFQLSIASACGIGTPFDADAALTYSIASARRGYLPAQASSVAFHVALGRQGELELEEQVDWLFEATAWGSFAAAECLKKLDLESFHAARAAFHRAGGYNQFFYSQDPPPWIHSAEFVQSVTRESDLQAFAQAAVIYGDITLLRNLLRVHELCPSLTNKWGESLLLLCCKAGHLDILKELVSFRAKAGSRPREESPLHWIIAFDVEDAEEAALILRQASEGTHKAADITWKHPSVDLPGHFPVGSPLHYSVFADSASHSEAIIKNFDIPLNWAGSSPSSPIEDGIARRKIRACSTIAANGALEDPSQNTYTLIELGQNLRYETWVAAAVVGESSERLVNRCLDLVLSSRPELLDHPAKGGFTPLMSAVQYHDRETVKALIDRGCDVNARTVPEYDDRTALNLITENKTQYPPDDILDLLRAAGADFSHRTISSGKLVLHFAARDDCVDVARELLDAGDDVDARTTTYHQTPLHIAAEYGSTAVAALLLQRGADTEATNAAGTYNTFDWGSITPLAVATARRRVEMVKLLLSCGASGLARPLSGHTALHLAVTEPDVVGLKMLLEIPQLVTGPMLNHQAAGGVTAMHLCAAHVGREEHLSLLLDAGADPNILTESAHSVLDAALLAREGLVSWSERLHKALSDNDHDSTAELLAFGASIWEPITVAGGNFSLAIGEGAGQMMIPLSTLIRTRETENVDTEASQGGDDVPMVETTESAGATSSGASCEDKDSSDEREHEVVPVDDPEVITVGDMLRRLDQSIALLRGAGATRSSTAAIPKDLFSMRQPDEEVKTMQY